MQEVAKAVIVITYGDVNNYFNDYFLVIDLATGKEVKRVSTEQLGACRCNNNYNEDEMIAKIAESCLVREYTVIRWY